MPTATRSPFTIMVVNPNTTVAMTDDIVAQARRVAAPGTTIVGSTSAHGVDSVESYTDEVWASVGVLEQIGRGEQAGVAAYVIACFGDAGVLAAREMARGPVVGMTEAALLTATLVGARFSVITLPRRTREQAVRAVAALGLSHRGTVRAIDAGVAETVGGSTHLLDAFVREAARAVELDAAEVIVLGCAGLGDLVAPLQQATGLPVVDGVAAAVPIAEGLVAQGLATSRANTFAAPPRSAPTRTDCP